MRALVTAYAAVTATLLLVLASCAKETAGVEEGGTGSLTLRIGTVPEAVLTKAGRSAAEGDEMSKLSVWVVRRGGGSDEGTIIIHEHLLSPGDEITSGGTEKESGSILSSVEFASDGKSAQMRFIDVPRGNFTLYAVANFEELDHGEYAVGKKIDENFLDMLVNTTALGDGESPKFDGETSLGMPCSAAVDFSIGAGENSVTAEMRRCVGRLTIAVRNNIAGSALFFKGVGLSARNPSKGYVFAHEGAAVPEGTAEVAFPEPDGFSRVPALTEEPVEIYDTFLYETMPEDKPFTFNLFGAAYPIEVGLQDVSLAYRQEYAFGTFTSDIPASDTQFLISSAASEDYYVGDNGGLSLRFFSDDAELKSHNGIENWFWTFSGTGVITNVGTGRQITLDGASASLSETGTTFTLTQETVSGISALRFSAGSMSLGVNPDVGIVGTNGKESEPETHWRLRKAVAKAGGENGIPYFKDASYEIPRVTRPFTYIDGYGVAQPLTHIDRNEHVRLVIGIFYNREIGQFGFTVEPWREKKSETTFD